MFRGVSKAKSGDQRSIKGGKQYYHSESTSLSRQRTQQPPYLSTLEDGDLYREYGYKTILYRADDTAPSLLITLWRTVIYIENICVKLTHSGLINSAVISEQTCLCWLVIADTQVIYQCTYKVSSDIGGK